MSSVITWYQRDRELDTQDTSKHQGAHSCPLHLCNLKESEVRTHKTWVSTSVLACVLCVCMVSKRERETKTQMSTNVLACVLDVPVVSWVSLWYWRDRVMDIKIKDMGKHWCAHSCPGCPCSVKGTRIGTYRTWPSTGVLDHVLCICAVSKNEK